MPAGLDLPCHMPIGRADDDAGALPLRAGPLHLVFEPATGAVRDVRLGDYEVLRGIQTTLRDHDWGTVPPRTTLREWVREARAFRLAFDAVCERDDVKFVWHVVVTGSADGTLRVDAEGRAQSAFRKNRIGVIVLHPSDACAGRPCEVEHTDGTREPTSFPREIAPYPPFVDVRALTHEVAPGVRAEVRFEGEVFETEDQRNWTDASFKTYGTPLALPFPVTVPAGAELRQSVTLRLVGPTAGLGAVGLAHASSDEIGITVDETVLASLPGIGLTLPHDAPCPTPREASRLRALALTHVRVDVVATRATEWDRLADALRAADVLGVALEIALFLPANAEAALVRARDALRQLRGPIARWLVFDAATRRTDPAHLRLARAVLGVLGAPIGGGTDAYFAQLNRSRPARGMLDVVSYSLNPQVHAFDDRSLMETLPIQGETVENAHRITLAPVVVGPVTLQPRFNPSATSGDEAALPSDPRLRTPFGAAWTLGSLASLARAGASSVTWFETTGPRGVMERDVGDAPAVHPLYHVLADARGAARPLVLHTRSDAQRCAALALLDGDRTRVLVANLTAEPQRVVLRGLATGTSITARVLDAPSADDAMHDPEAFRQRTHGLERDGDGAVRLELASYGSTCIEAA